jgi:Ser-tRNA(Ala) deacylase AlaX
MTETKLSFLEDSYAKEFDASIIEVINIENSIDTQSSSKELGDSTYLVLDNTLFYPTGGGQPCDLGKIILSGNIYEISEVIKREGRVLHKIGSSKITSDSHAEFRSGQKIHGIIDWDRRYKLMRMHTASHLIDAILYSDGKVMVTGNSLGIDKTRIDFNMPEFSLEKVQHYINLANNVIEKNLCVKNYYLSRDEAFKIPGIVKLAGALPPNISILRITEIEGIDIQADGGTHVKSLKEIGKINLLDIENKGKDRKRVYFELQD